MQVLVLYYSRTGNTKKLDATDHYEEACTGAPNEKTTSNAAKLGKKVAVLIKKLEVRT